MEERDAINPQLQLEGEQINIRADGGGDAEGVNSLDNS